MRLVYLIPELYNPGGTARVLHNKICWFACHGEYEITVVTTDQGQAPVYFDFPKGVRIIDLDINYSSVYSQSPFRRLLSISRKKRLHYRRLKKLLYEIKPDATVTIYPSDTVSLSRLKDGSKKILEFHYSRFFRLHQGYKGYHQLIAKYRTWLDYKFVKKFDRVVVLTNEDANQWSLPNLKVIPNAPSACRSFSKSAQVVESKRVIAVGRLVYEKGFDQLIKAWSLLPKDILEKGWKLDIFGDGVLQNYLNDLIRKCGVGNSVRINAPTKQIFNEYAKSAFLVMTSRAEGFGMVMVEAMSCGIPVISFDFSCGPKDIIEDGVNGLLVENGNIQALAIKIGELILDKKRRTALSENAVKISDSLSEEKVMRMWEQCFAELKSA